jgi:hypothetical protein
LAGKKKGEASDAAIRHIENMKESMAEDAEQQVADQYPKGTKVYDRMSRNRAKYGKPVDLPPEGKAKGGSTKAYAKGGVTRADGCATKGHTKGRMV